MSISTRTQSGGVLAVRPLPFIASLRRTGSTLLSRALTSWPREFVFREPGLVRRRCRVKPDDVDLFDGIGVDLRQLFVKLRRAPLPDRAAVFVNHILPVLRSVVPHIGIKEIHHEHWRDLADAIELRVVVTARDPRDIYMSLVAKQHRRRKPIRLDGPFGPEAIARNLKVDFEHQRAMLRELPCLAIRYEDLCRDHKVLASIRAFFELPPSSDHGDLHRLPEHVLAQHGSAITDQSVGRWRTAEPGLRSDAARMLELMPEYAEFWGYE